VLSILDAAREASEASPWNVESGAGDVGVVASGISRAYLADALAETGLEGKVRVFDLGFTHPLPIERLAAFLASVRTVVVLEELEPLVEKELRALAQERSIAVRIVGKGELLPRTGEYTVQIVARAVCAAAGADYAAPETAPATGNLPMRPPNLCAGCSHRAAYYAVRQVFGDDAYYSSDIGCYTLGILPPLKAADFLLCMGSSVSAGSGFARASGQTVVGFIGDSTFFHSGITGLVNAVFNNHDVVVMVLDNRTTAMTGHQPHPGVDVSLMNSPHAQLDIESVVRGLGVNQVWKVKPYNVKATMKALEEAKAAKGVRVVIAEEPCVLFARRTLKKSAPQAAYVAEQGEDTRRVVETLACPAFFKDENGYGVDENACSGCMVCVQLIKNFKARKRSA
jgi:indolepyruvate ferredoxin oxidoreductase alpha subunit